MFRIKQHAQLFFFLALSLRTFLIFLDFLPGPSGNGILLLGEPVKVTLRVL